MNKHEIKRNKLKSIMFKQIVDNKPACFSDFDDYKWRQWLSIAKYEPAVDEMLTLGTEYQKECMNRILEYIGSVGVEGMEDI